MNDSKNNLQKLGGFAALFNGLAYLIGFAGFLTLLTGLPDGSVAQLEFLLERQYFLHVWYAIIYVLFGISLVVLAISISEALKSHAPKATQIMNAFGLIWAGLVMASGMVAVIGLKALKDWFVLEPEQAASAWIAVSAVQDGIGGGVEIVGGLWMVLVSWIALRNKLWAKSIHYLGIAAGAAGLLTIVPLLEELGAVFGIGQIFWFFLIGRSLLVESQSPER